MTDMTTILTCDKCGLSYRASLIPHECADWTKGSNKHKGDVMERRDWTVSQRAVAYMVLDGVVSCNKYFPEEVIEWAQRLMRGEQRVGIQLIRESITEHTALVRQRDLLVEALRQIRAAYNQGPNAEKIRMAMDAAIDYVDNALATVEQGGEA